jgi:hypothetical protein
MSVDKMLDFSTHADLALLKTESTERALHLKMATKTADRSVSGS